MIINVPENYLQFSGFIMCLNSTMEHILSMSQTLFEFACCEELANWQVANDDVMGGNSTSHLNWNTSKTITFSGELSQENKGGFASARTLISNFEAKSGVSLRIRGDLKYKFKLRTDPFLDGINYVHPFQGNYNQWQEIHLPFSDFKPSFRGLILPDAAPLDPSKIQQIGILISDSQTGPFSLEIDWIKAY